MYTNSIELKISLDKAMQFINSHGSDDVFCTLQSRTFRLEEDILSNKPEHATTKIVVPEIWKTNNDPSSVGDKSVLMPADPFDHQQWMSYFWDYFEKLFTEHLLNI